MYELHCVSNSRHVLTKIPLTWSMVTRCNFSENVGTRSRRHLYLTDSFDKYNTNTNLKYTAVTIGYFWNILSLCSKSERHFRSQPLCIFWCGYWIMAHFSSPGNWYGSSGSANYNSERFKSKQTVGCWVGISEGTPPSTQGHSSRLGKPLQTILLSIRISSIEHPMEHQPLQTSTSATIAFSNSHQHPCEHGF